MKSYDDTCKEINVFLRLKPEERAKHISLLGERLRSLDEGISQCRKAQDEGKTELTNAVKKRDLVVDELKEARERRQNAVALKEDPKKITAEIEELKGAGDLWEDTCIGMERRLESLASEEVLLESERKETNEYLVVFKTIPLVEEYNSLGKKMADVLKKIVTNLDPIVEGPFWGASGRRFFAYSNPEALDLIGKIYVAAQISPEDRWPNGRLKDIFDLRAFREELRRGGG
ncbi:MAG: hypothetical protein FJ130_05210 [Deltaproteobacteria bacterium]|nr:hypothetical protein [Deltaproteobacteria bacterium]